MKKLILGTVLSLGVAAGASAQPAAPVSGGDITRAAAVADAERQFAALDANRDGQLEAAEMRQVFEQRRAERQRRMEERLAQMSPEDRARFEQRRAERGGEGGARRGGDGARRGGGAERGPVTLAQFRAQAEQRFDRLDLDRNGVITTAEQAQLRAQRGSRSE